MATKKAASTKKSTVKKPAAKKTTKVASARTSSRSSAVRKRIANNSYTGLAASSLAELVGTFILAAIVLSQNGQPVPVMFGIIAAVLAVGALSGGYLNPALAVGAWATKRLSGVRTLAYIVAQMLGGMLALVVVDNFIRSSAPKITEQMAQFGQTAPEVFRAASVPDDKVWLVLFAELIGTAIFALVVASAVSEKRKSLTTAISVGTGLFAGLLVAGSATASLAAQGTGLTFLNPAVAVAAQVFSNDVLSWWSFSIFMVVPLIGGALGFGLYELFKYGQRTSTAK